MHYSYVASEIFFSHALALVPEKELLANISAAEFTAGSTVCFWNELLFLRLCNDALVLS
jgi:hypothetical protein